MTTTLNRRERKAAQLLAHYATCERLGKALGMPSPDGKKISVALFKLEREAHSAMEHACSYPELYWSNFFHKEFCFAETEGAMEDYKDACKDAVQNIFGGTLPPGFFVNGDPRGHALKLDPENEEAKHLIEATGMQTDWGGYGILSPEINGD